MPKQSALQLLPAGTPTVPSQTSGAGMKPSPHSWTRVRHCAVQAPVGGPPLSSHCSAGGSILPSPQVTVQSAGQPKAPPPGCPAGMPGSQSSPVSSTALPHSTLLHEKFVRSGLLHSPLLSVTVTGMLPPLSLAQPNVVDCEPAAAKLPTAALAAGIDQAYLTVLPSRSWPSALTAILLPTLAVPGMATA